MRKPFKPQFFQKNRGPRINEQIRVPLIRLIDEKGQNLGEMPPFEALKMARERNLDLLEISAKAQPPVCKIMDFGKYQYQKSKEEKKQKVKQKKNEVKEIRISMRIAQNDMNIRIKRAEKFINEGHKLKIDIILKGREKGMLDLANKKLTEFVKMLPFEIIIEQPIRKNPRGLSILISKKNQ